MVVAAAVDDADQAILVEPLEADHGRMEAETVGELDRPGVPGFPDSAGRGSTPDRRTGRPCSTRRCRPRARRRRESARAAFDARPFEGLRNSATDVLLRMSGNPAPTPMP